MKLQLVGCSHHNSTVDALERLAFAPDQIVETLQVARRQFPATEAVLLSTCNRVEFYLAAEEPTESPSLRDMTLFLANCRQFDAAELSGAMYAHSDEDAVRHLFTVAASLDSMVVGESQILSQVKQAFSIARQNHSTGPLTHFIFERANHVAKRVATETAINRKRVSIASVAIADCAKQLFETFHDKHILLLGAGQMGEETLRYLQNEGASQIVVLNRGKTRAEELANRVGGSVDSWDRISDRLAWADLVVSTTGSPEPIVTSDRFRTIQQNRHGRPLLVLDLAVPRDFEADIGDFADVYLYRIDDLQAVCDQHRRARRGESAKAARIVDEEITRYLTEQAHRAIGPTIRRFKEQTQTQKDEELARLFNKLGDIDHRSRKEIERSFDRLVNKLLHPPLESLREEAKQGSGRTLVHALRHLFQISE